MQLFYTSFQQTGNEIIVKNEELITQMKKVLRFQIGAIFFVQNEVDGKTVRHKVILKKITRDLFSGIIKDSEFNSDSSQKTMIIAMPNKRQKVELITQKLTEIWIWNIIFWPSERSIIKVSNKNKMLRLEKIAKEAMEQSWWWKLPKISFEKTIWEIIRNEKIIIFDKKNTKQNDCDINTKKTIGIVGPEGGFTKNDYIVFWDNICIKPLWNTILRTETASIIGAWKLINDF